MSLQLPRPRLTPRVLTVTGVAFFLAAYAVQAYLGFRNTSVTYDEPLHLVAAYLIRHHSDFRMNPEDPPLFQRYLALALPRDALAPDFAAAEWDDVRLNLAAHWTFVNRTLFPPPGSLPPGIDVDHASVVRNARSLMLTLGVTVGALTAVLAACIARSLARTAAPPTPEGKPAGRLSPGALAGLAAVVAAAVFAFEPTFLGHGPLIKNDVPLALAFTATALALAGLAGRVTFARFTFLTLAAAAGVTTKFSGLLLGPFVAGLLVLRAMLPGTWTVFGVPLTTRPRRLLAAGGLTLAAAVVSLAAIWAVYGFRFSFSPDPRLRADLSPEVAMARTFVARLENPTRMPTTADMQHTPTPRPIAAAVRLHELELLPETFLKGFAYTYATTLLRSAFLLNEISESGWWYYFPLAMAFKLPLGVLALLGVLPLTGLALAYRRYRRALARQPQPASPASPSPTPLTHDRWPLVACVLPAAAYLAVAMNGNMNLGIRHLLPILPLLLAPAVALSVVLAVRFGTPARVLLALAVLATAAESLAARGNYIAFFNLPAQRLGPHKLLTDSNLDWGQHLPLLVDWQRRHPDIPLALSYFGTATPEAYGLRYTPLVGTAFSRARPQVQPPVPSVVAVSATWLQEVYMTPSARGAYSLFRYLRPREVLGNTLFLYDWPPGPDDLLPQPWTIHVRAGDVRYPIPLRSALPTQ